VSSRTVRCAFGLVAAAFAAVALDAQPAARRGTTILALKSYPGFYHLQTVAVIGDVKGQGERATIATDEGSLRIVAREMPDETRLEVRGQLLDIGRLSQDDPRLIPFNLLDRVRAAYPDRWPRPGEELVLVLTSTDRPPAPADVNKPPLRAVAMEPERFAGHRATVVGQFRGRNLYGDLPEAPVTDKWAFVLRSADAALWVVGRQPRGRDFNFDPSRRLDAGRWMQVTGTVRAGKGMAWIEAAAIELAPAPAETPVISEPPPPPPPVEVLFTAPTAGEIDVEPTTAIRVQFSRDLDPASIKGRLRVRYEDEAGAEAAEVVTTYTPANRALEIRPAEPWKPFRTVRVEFMEGVTGTDGGALRPFVLTFRTGGQVS
jgi:hypothetical protein